MGAIARAGAVVIPGRAPEAPSEDRNARYNTETDEVMRRVMTPDSNGVDVGAFDGGVIAPMATIAPQGRHVAIEPQREYAERLRARHPNVRVLELALGDRAGTRDFVEVVDRPALSGFREQEYPTDHERLRTVTVRVETLDDVVASDTPVAFIKIDVEGAEYLVLRGGAKVIRRDRPVIALEYGRAGRDSYGTTPEMIWQLLHEDFGLEVSLMRTWLDGGPPLTASAFRAIVESGSDWMFLAHPARGTIQE